MAEIDKLAKVIVNSNELLGRRIDNLTKALGSQKAPVVNVAPPVVNVEKQETPIVNVEKDNPIINVEQPEINVEIPEIKVPTPQVTVKTPVIDLSGIIKAVESINSKNKDVDLSDIESLLEDIRDTEIKDNDKILKDILNAIKEIPEAQEVDFSELLTAVKGIRVTGHGGVSSKRNIQNATGITINPSVAVSDKEVLSTDNPQGTIFAGQDDDGKAQYVGVTGVKQDSTKTGEINSNFLKEILLELKAINRHNELITESQFDGTE